MAAYFESGVFTDNVPAWHNMGIVVEDEHLTKDRIFELVPEIASPVVPSSDLFASYVVGDDGAIEIANTDGWTANVRTLDNRVLGVVSNSYELVQNDELFDLGEQIVDAGARWKTAGTLKDGRVVWGMLEIPDVAKIAGEEYQANLVVTNSFDGSMGMRVATTDTRVVCWNTLSWALDTTKRSHTIRHTANARVRLHEAKAALQLAYDYHAHLAAIAEVLVARKIGTRMVDGIVARLVPYTPEADVSDRVRVNIDNRRSDIATVWRDSPNLDHIRYTAWGGVQAVAEYEQHYMTDRSRAQAFQRVIVDGEQPLTRRMLALSTS